MVFKKALSLLMITALLFSGFLGPLALETEAVDIGWQLVGSAGFSGDVGVQDIEIAVSENGSLYAAILDFTNDEIAVMEYTGEGSTGWELVGNKIPTQSSEIDMALYDDSIYVLFRDYVSSEVDGPKVVKFTKGITEDWQTVGSGRVVEGYCYFLSIDTDSSGVPYVAYRDMTDLDNAQTYGKGTAMKYTGLGDSGWEPLGDSGFTGTNAEYTSIAVDSSNNVYVAYKVMEDDNKARVMKYDGSGWSFVGDSENPAISPGGAFYVDLNINSQDEPYVAFQDRANDFEATVMKYNGTNWSAVGDYGFTSEFSFSSVEYLDIRFDSEDNPYVGYSSQREYVLKYDGGWNAVGTLPANHDYYSDNNSTFVHNNIAYIGFQDSGNDGNVTVMKYAQPEVPADQTIDISDIQGIAPVIGESPSSTIETSQYTGSIAWSPEDSAFDYETIYTATITLTPKAGYTVNGITKDFFNVYGATSTANDADSSIITAVFPITDANWQMVGDSFTDIYTEGLEVEDDFYINSIDVSIDSQGTPYIAMTYKINYGGVESKWKSAVKKYETNQWIDLNSSEISDASTQYINIEINNDDRPAIAYYEHDYIMETACIRIKEWDGSTWQTLGNTSEVGSHSPGVFDFKLHGGVPYLAYGDWDGDPYGSAAVTKYENDEWTKIGENLSDGAAWALNLALDSNGYPYISYVKQGTPYYHIVQSYNGQSWETMKNYTDKEVSTAYYSDIILDSTNTAYLAYKDTNNKNEASVVKWNNDSWELVGIPGFTDDGNDNSVSQLDLELDSNDQPILSLSHNTYQTGQNVDYVYKYKSNQWISLRSDYFSTYLYNMSFDTYQNNGYLTYSMVDGGQYHGILLEYTSTEGYVTPPPTPGPGPSIPALEIETEVLPDGHEGEEYEFQLEAEGGIKPYSWTASGLPEGLEISADGKIFGIPQSAGDFMIKLELLDSRNYYRSSVAELYIEEKEEETEEPEFTDISGHWFIDFLRRVFYRGIIVGYPDRTFRPDSIVTRGEFATMIIRTFKLDPIAGTLFTDTSGYWGESNINGAVGRGIITGYTDNSFRPNVPITREEMAVMLSRALNIEEDIIEDYFDDIGSASPWARLSIRRLGNLKILTGFPEGTFRPKDTLTRAEAVKVIYEIISNE